MTFQEFCVLFAKGFSNRMREGQRASNLLCDHRHNLFLRMTGGIDPFYVDDKLPAFWEWVEENWDG